MDLISSIIAACSGPMASGVRIRTLYYQGTPITVKEGALGDGVGAKVWTVAHTLCQELVENPSMVVSKSVLEIGAGCGPCGLLAAKLGATEVVISDYVDQLLLNLRDALHLNGLEEESIEELNGNGGEVETVVAEADFEINDDWDPEEDGGSECSDIDAFFGQAEGEASRTSATWEAGKAAVRFLDWGDSVVYLEEKRRKEAQKTSADAINAEEDAATEERSTSYCGLDGASTRSAAPGIPASKQFDVILGTDILYEWPMAESVAAAIAHRLRPGGRAMVCNAVRDQSMFDALIANMRGHGLRVAVQQIEPRQEDGGIAPHDQPYEGGFVFVCADHETSPAQDWHRNDLFS